MLRGSEVHKYDGINSGYEFCIWQSACLDLSSQLVISYVLATATGVVAGAFAHYIWEKYIRTSPSMKEGNDAR